MSKKRTRREKWTDEETNELLRLRTAGVPYKEIATQINRSAHACVQQYSKVKDAVANRKVKVTELHKHMKQLGDPQQEPYTHQPLSVPSTERNNKAWTRKEDKLLKSMVRHKATMLQLMTALKRTEKAIDSRIRTLSKKKTYKPRPAKVDTVSEIDAELLVNFIRGLQEENKQLRAKLESIRNALENND
tara:strand:- start:482 stop:1048 length:567 start_codon:yes stop_codon:yes gene_type:complete